VSLNDEVGPDWQCLEPIVGCSGEWWAGGEIPQQQGSSEKDSDDTVGCSGEWGARGEIPQHQGSAREEDCGNIVGCSSEWWAGGEIPQQRGSAAPDKNGDEESAKDQNDGGSTQELDWKILEQQLDSCLACLQERFAGIELPPEQREKVLDKAAESTMAAIQESVNGYNSAHRNVMLYRNFHRLRILVRSRIANIL